MSVKTISRTVVLLSLSAGVFAVQGWAFDNAAHEKLVGVWQPQDGAGSDAGTWTIEMKDNDVVKITHSQGDQKTLDFECKASGTDCKVKDAGKSAKVSLWFNGEKLVGLETKGDEVVKRRFAVAATGDVLDVEVMPISPSGKTETVHYKRVHQ